MREFAIFFVDFLTDDGTGRLVTCPSLSPENRYILPDDYDSPICAGPAMDNQILRDLFDACIQTDELLGTVDDWTEAFKAARARLPEDKVGSKGQLLEWQEELPEKMPGMGHISHLYAAYPSNQINWKDTPDLMNAVRRSIELRVASGADGGGWPLAWRMCQYARQLDGEKVGTAVQKMIGQATSSFLLQSHIGLIHLLPALPSVWDTGSVNGMVARGAVRVDMTWKSGKLTGAVLHPAANGELHICAEPELTVLADGKEIPAERTTYGIRFFAEAGKEYTLRAVK